MANEPENISFYDYYSNYENYLFFNEESDSYYYPGDIESLKKPWTKQPHVIPTLTIYGLALLIGIIGNIFVIFAVFGHRKSRSVTSSFMVSLAVADILFLAICVPYEATRHVIVHWAMGPILCKITGFIEMLTAVASILNLSSVSVERFIVIVLPIKSRRVCTAGNSQRIMLIVWMVSIAISSPSLYVMDTEFSKFHNNDTSVVISMCSDFVPQSPGRLAFAIYKLLIMFIFPTIVMTVCYAGVIYALWISSKQLTSLTSATRLHPSSLSQERVSLRHTESSTTACAVTGTPFRFRKYTTRNGHGNHSVDMLKARRQVIKMLVAVVVVFLLCWGPKLTMDVLSRLHPEFLYTPEAFYSKVVLYCLPYIQSCLNPFIYCFMSQNFRRSIKATCHRHGILCRCTTCCVKTTNFQFADFEMESKLSIGTTHTRLSVRNSRSMSSTDYNTVVNANGWVS